MATTDNSIKKNISKNITKYRESAGLSQKELASLLNVTPSRVSNWEQGANCPTIDMLFELCKILDVSINDIYGVYPDSNMQLAYDEIKHIKKYRSLDQFGQETVTYILDRESARTMRMAELESKPDNIIEFTPSPDDTNRLVEYFNSASAGTGIFIMGNEATEQLPIPDTKENKKVDYAIKVSGKSMEPDFYDGDIALVSHREELNYGDVGIFIINNNAYIKEYGEKELISRNPKADNIMIEEYDNIVCMGKVIGKL